MALIYKNHVEYFFLSAIVGACSLGVSYIAKMNSSIEQMTLSVQILTEKLTTIDRTAQDHEQRIRYIERSFGKPE